MSAILAAIGRPVAAAATTIGGMTLLMLQILRSLIPPRLDPMETWRNLYKVGVKRFGIVVVTALLVGAIMVIQTGALVAEFDA